MTCKHVSFASKIPTIACNSLSVSCFVCDGQRWRLRKSPDFLAKEEAPLLFLYSSSDTLIKPAAVEEYIKTCTRNKLSFQYAPAVSSSLMQYVYVPSCPLFYICWAMIQPMTCFLDSILFNLDSPSLWGEGQASSKRFAGSQHVRHFQKHFESGTQRHPSFAQMEMIGWKGIKI